MRHINKETTLLPFVLLYVATARLIGTLQETRRDSSVKDYYCIKTIDPDELRLVLTLEEQTKGDIPLPTDKRFLANVQLEECYSPLGDRGECKFNTTTVCPTDTINPADCFCLAAFVDGKKCQSCTICEDNATNFRIVCANVIPTDSCASVDCGRNCISGPDWVPKVGTSGTVIAVLILIFLVLVFTPCIIAVTQRRVRPAYAARVRQRLIRTCIVTKKVGPECNMEKSSGMKSRNMENNISEQSQCPTSKRIDKRESPVSAENSVVLTLDQASDSSLEETINDDDPCQICLEPFRNGEEMTWSNVSNCPHVFHHDCIVEWLQRHDECPCCRAKYLSASAENG